LLNFTPVERKSFSIGVPYPGSYKEVLNSAWAEFGGSSTAKPQKVKTREEKFKNYDYQITVDLPGFSAMILQPDKVTIKRKRSKKHGK
jgi:1,4-alpha-glucan branching enzyme